MKKALLLLTVATACAYAGVVDNGFVSVDDIGYLALPYPLQQGLSLDFVGWALTTFEMSNWHPLTWISYAIDVSLFGASPVGVHVENVALHLGAALLLALALMELKLSRVAACMTAATLALHPIHVESVAWAAERKDVLSGLALAGMLLAWARYAARPRAATYAAALLACVLGLLAKPSFVSAPVVLLLVDLWPLGRHRTVAWRRLAVEKMPFAVLGVAVSGLTLLAQTDALRTALPLPLSARLANAIVALARYGEKLLIPTDLCAFYPFPPDGHPPGRIVWAIAVLAVVALWATRRARRGSLDVAVGVVAFVVMVFPMLGILQVGRQAMADRYAYLPSVLLTAGLFAALVEGASVRRLRASVVAFLVVAAAWCGLTRAQVRTWRTTEAMLDNTLAKTRDNVWALWVYADEDLGRGLPESARLHNEAALAIEPDNVSLLERQAQILVALGRAGEALVLTQALVERAPDRPKVARTHARVLAAVGAEAAAIESFQRAIFLGSTEAASCESDIGVLLMVAGRVDEARFHLELASAMAPERADLADRARRARLTAAPTAP